jgi:hypothetical protein
LAMIIYFGATRLVFGIEMGNFPRLLSKDDETAQQEREVGRYGVTLSAIVAADRAFPAAVADR